MYLISNIIAKMKSIFKNKYLFCILAISLLVYVAVYYKLWLTHEEILTHDAIMWFGTYNYFIDCLLNYHLPLWDPYGQCGNSFFQNITLLGLLDPVSMFYTLAVKLLPLSIFNSFTYMYITRIVVASVGAYFAYWCISGSKICAKVGAVVFFMSLFSSSLHQNGFVNLFVCMPWILFFSLKYLDNVGQKYSKKYLYGAATTLGISLNIYIPVYTLFYLFLFYLISFLTGAIKFRQLGKVFSFGRWKELLLATVIVLLFCAIPLAVYLNDIGLHGQLFPYLRAYTSNGGLDKIMVSDISTTALSGKFYKEERITSTFLNLVQLIAPFHWEIKWKLMDHLHFQETFQFVGVASILIIICGIRFRSRFRYTAIVTTIVIILTFTGYKTIGGTYLFHNILEIFFPPLRLIKVYESFLGAHLFNLGLLLTMGLHVLQKTFISDDLYKKSLYCIPFFVYCLVVYLISFIITFLTSSVIYSLKSAPFLQAALIHTKSLIYLAIILIAIFSVIYSLKLSWITLQVGFFCLITIILVELIIYNLPFNFRQITLSPNYLRSDDPIVHHRKPNIYENFRSIYIPAYFRFVTFQEALMKRSAVFPDIFHPMGNVLFVSKRYYEFITHVNRDNIFAVSGITSPKSRFFEEAFIMNNRKDALELISSIKSESLRDSLLIIEIDKSQDFNFDFQHRTIMPNECASPKIPPLEIKNLLELCKHIFPLVKGFAEEHFSRIDSTVYGFQQDWPLYINLEATNSSEPSIPKELLTLDNKNIGRTVVTCESMPAVLLSGISKNVNPVFMVPRRSYGEMAYNEGTPIEIYTVVDGNVISTKPFSGYYLFDTFNREINEVDQRIKNLSFSPNKVSFSIQNQIPGFFYYADSWSPYWKAYDNNKPVPVLKANYNFKAVFLPAGEHVVTFVYRPVHYLFALGCYCLGLILGMSLTIVLYLKEYVNKEKPSISMLS